jgi:hypothetical protein
MIMSNVNEITLTAAELAMTVSEFSEHLKKGGDNGKKCTLQVRTPSLAHEMRKPSKQIHKRPKHQTVRPHRMLELTLFEAVQRFMEDHLVPPALVESTVKTFIQLYSESTMMDGSGILYSWNSGLKKVQYRFTAKAVQAFITAMVDNMPEPVQKIRNEILHGTNVQFEFDPGVQKYMRCADKLCTPYMIRKISQHERMITGQVYERALHRTTDSGQGGRRFSDADVSDIMGRTMILAFCPLYCRSIPITDKGHAFVAVRKASVRRWIGTRTVNRRAGNRGMKKLWDTVKKFRANKITEQEYNEFLSKFNPKNAKMQAWKETNTGFWIEWTCEQTGQKFRTFTRSAGRAEQLSNMTSFCGEGEKVYNTADSEPMFMEPSSVFSYRQEGRFFRTLKHITRNLYRYLFRRTEHDDMLVTEHKSSLMARKSNRIHEFSMNELMEESSLLTPEQLDIVATELTLPENLPITQNDRERRVEMFRQLVAERTGSVPDITRHEYAKLREREFIEIRHKLESSSSELLYDNLSELVSSEMKEIAVKMNTGRPSKKRAVYSFTPERTVTRQFRKSVLPFTGQSGAKWIMSTTVKVGKFTLDGWQTDKGYYLNETTGDGDGI